MRALIDYRAALRERTGVGEYSHEVAAAMLKACANGSTAEPGVDLTLFSSSWKDRLLPDPSIAGAALVDRRIPVKLLNLAWHRLEWPPIESIAGRFDVVHSMHPLLLPASSAAQVVTIHDLNFLRHPERTRAEIRRDYPELARSHALRADHVIVVSRFTAVEVQEAFGVPDERLSICSPGGPGWPPRAARPASGYVLFFGTLEPRKNVGALLDAYETLAARNGDVPKLVLAGKATEESRPWLERAARPPLQGHVETIGYVPPEQRRALYEGAILLVQPSFEEGFGLPVLEAMTAGVPVVAANRGALPEVLGGAGQLVDPDDREQMADAIARVVNDTALAAAMTSAGLTRARHYSWTETAKRTVAAYQSAIARRRGRRGAA